MTGIRQRNRDAPPAWRNPPVRAIGRVIQQRHHPGPHPAPAAPEKAQDLAQGEGAAPLPRQHPVRQAHRVAAAAGLQPPGIKSSKRDVEKEGGPVGHPAKPSGKNVERTSIRRSQPGMGNS